MQTTIDICYSPCYRCFLLEQLFKNKINQNIALKFYESILGHLEIFLQILVTSHFYPLKKARDEEINLDSFVDI